MVSDRSLDVLCISLLWKWRITTEQASCLTKIRVNAFLCSCSSNCVIFKLESLEFCFLAVWYARDWGLFKSRSIRILINFCWRLSVYINALLNSRNLAAAFWNERQSFQFHSGKYCRAGVKTGLTSKFQRSRNSINSSSMFSQVFYWHYLPLVLFPIAFLYGQ